MIKSFIKKNNTIVTVPKAQVIESLKDGWEIVRKTFDYNDSFINYFI